MVRRGKTRGSARVRLGSFFPAPRRFSRRRPRRRYPGFAQLVDAWWTPLQRAAKGVGRFRDPVGIAEVERVTSGSEAAKWRGVLSAHRTRSLGRCDRVGVATPDQVRHRSGLSEPMCWRRLRALREHGRAKAARPLAGPSVLYPAGTPVPSVGHLDHALAATSVALALELQGAEVVTERQMRRDEYRAKDRTLWSIPMAAGQGIGRQPTHRPDMVIVEAHGLVAVEVELTRKSERRLGQLMAAWARQGRYHEVRYLCRSAFLSGLVLAKAREHGADLVVRSTLLAEALLGFRATV